MDDTLRVERDALVTLGVLSHNYLFFDPPISVGDGKITHCRGFNVHGCVIDNRDGEVLAVAANAIHAHDDPLQHAEQRVLRKAISRLHAKQPRSASQTVEEYYKSSMFMAPGTAAGDYLRTGCTLYNTFDPCAMCAVTLLVAYMKRVVYVVEDAKFAAVYEDMKQKYFSTRQSIKEPADYDRADSPLIRATRDLVGRLRAKVATLAGVELVHSLDHCRDELAAAAEALRTARAADLVADDGEDRRRNRRTLEDLQLACHFPVTPAA